MDYMIELAAIAKSHGGIIETKTAAGHGISKAMLYKLCNRSCEVCVGIPPSSRVDQGLSLPSVTVRWTVTGRKKDPDFRLSLCVGITYLPGQSPAKYCRRR